MNTRHQQDEAPPEPLWDRAPDCVAYRRSRRNITELLLAARPGAAGVPVPACPGWTVLDLLGHLVEVCRTVAADVPGNLWEVPHAESGTGLAGLLEEWSRLDGPVERVLSDTPQLRHTMMMMDAFTHELDLRGALRAPVVADQPSYPSALDLVVRGFANSVRSHGLPALRIRTAGAEWQAGDGEPAAVLQGHRHDLLRSLTGRRTVGQVSGLAWSTAPDAWLPAFTWGPFRPPERPVEAAVAAR